MIAAAYPKVRRLNDCYSAAVAGHQGRLALNAETEIGQGVESGGAAGVGFDRIGAVQAKIAMDAGLPAYCVVACFDLRIVEQTWAVCRGGNAIDRRPG